MVTVSLTQAKTRLGELLDEVETGQEVIITRRGKAVAHLSSAIGPQEPLPLRESVEFQAAMSSLRSALRHHYAEVLRERYGTRET